MKSLANFFTTLRIFLAVFVIFLLTLTSLFQLIAILLIPIVMTLDLFDGMVARKIQTSSLAGSIYDIFADRFIELAFFIFFAMHYICSFWVVLIILWRGLAIDALRSFALRYEKTAFGKNSLHQQTWSKFLTNSKCSRGTYNTLKTITFMLMALQLFHPSYIVLTHCMVGLTVAWSLLRAIPVFIDGWKVKPPISL